MADTIGAKIAYWRKRRGKSQRVLAGLAGISQPYLANIECGRRPLERRSTLVGLADALEVSVAELTGQPGDPTDPGRARAAVAVPAIRQAVIMRQAGITRPPPAEPGPDAALEAIVATDFAALGPMLPGLLAGCTGPDLVRVGYAAMFHLRYTGYGDLAREVAALALADAQQRDDPTWLAVAEFVRANALPAETADLAGELARQAADAVQPHAGLPQARQAYGMLHLTAALRAAAAGRGGDAQAHLAEAAGEADTLGEPDGTGVCSLGFGPTNVGIWRLAVLTELGDPDEAAGRASEVEPERSTLPNRQAVYWLDYGRALAGLGRDSEAIAAFLRAETVCPQFVRLRPTVRDTVAVILRRTRARAVSPPLRRAAEMVGLPI